MRVIEEEVTKEKFEMLSKLKDEDKEKYELELNIPIEWYCGYGYYGSFPVEKGGKFYIIHNIGNSCD